MIIDCHGHYTTAPKALQDYRDAQIAALKDPTQPPYDGKINISDDQIRESLEGAQLKLQRERGTDVTIFSPRASAMAHHIGTATTSADWSRHCNDLIHRVCTLYPSNFVGVCQLPQSPGVPPQNVIEELVRCVNEFGFIGCNLNPDPSGGHWTAPPLIDKYWYPVYEKMVELDVPAMVHVSSSCNPVFHATGAHYINADTVPFTRNRAAAQSGAGGQHSVRIGDGRSRARHRSTDRAILRRHEEVSRRASAERRRSL
jgi:4-oxalmesaconate hydratase